MSSWSIRKYDVFISFRGEDVRRNFISHLGSALHRGNIEAFVDANLEKGDEVWPSLCEAIHDSHLAIVVFSENYADSKWCLKELVEILHCRKIQGLAVIPVFYQVDPSHIRKYSGTYGEAIAKHETYFGDTDNESIQDWKAALTEAANICGWDSCSHDYKNESHLIEKIVQDVSQKLSLRSPVQLKVEDLVEIEKHCDEVKQLLSKNQKHQFQENVQIIGIWGMGGLGKTTIAKALFSQMFPQYDAVCFLANVREESERFGLNSLRGVLLSKLLQVEHKYDPEESTMKRLSNKKVLIVLDDVDSLDQLDVLCRQQCKYAGPNSKLIITTRDRHLLRGIVDENEIYDVKPWGSAKSLELFCLHAFKQRLPKKGYEKLSERAVEYAGGVPLALEVLGSNLCCRSTEFWVSELRKLDKCLNLRIQNVLQVSYDGLDNLEKNIFLDIAFFFKGEDKDDVIRILDACGFCATSGVQVLEDKALITISYSGTIQMHDLIQEMGLYIVRGGCKDPNKRTRLRDIEEVSDVLENNKGSDVVEGIQLDLSQIENVRWKADTFNMMTNLRFLKLYVPSGKKSGNVHHCGVFSKLSAKLRYLEWNGCFLKSLPVTFCAKMLVEICMPHSHVTELWQGVQDVANLVRIDLSECKHLKNLPDLSKASRLKWVNLFGCESLCDIHPSVFSFDTLETLILDGCKKLKSLKSEKHLTSLENISVNLCTSLKEFSVSSDSITSLDLSSTDGSNVKTLPASIKDLFSLRILSVENCRKLGSLTELPPFVTELNAMNCRSLRTVSTLRESYGIFGVKSRFILFKNCVALDEPSLHYIMEAAHSETKFAASEINYKFVKVCFPGSRVPGHFEYRTTDSSITIDLPPSRPDFVGLCLCVVLSHSWGMKNLGAKIWCQCYVANGRRLGPATTWYDEVVTGLNSDHVFIWYDRNHSDRILEIYDTGERRVSFEFFVTNAIGQRLTIGTLECGVFLIFGQKNHLYHTLVNEFFVSLMAKHAGLIFKSFIRLDKNDCIDINNQERDLTEDGSCSCDCLFGMELTMLFCSVYVIFCVLFFIFFILNKKPVRKKNSWHLHFDTLSMLSFARLKRHNLRYLN
uniref:ADP-ribosyl cyclase/cyclic ADP-ribose hydrolase n=1 Tax=Cajanus cajan TaxID=3821 RepID=A0A151TEQ1_CAJCA|nr:Putative disease resistance protein At4g11170 family [Cajanus cajan]